MLTQRTNARIASAWQSMAASAAITMRIRRAPDPSPSTSELLEKSLTHKEDAKPDMVGPLLFAFVFMAFALFCYVMSLIWAQQHREIQLMFIWLSCLCGFIGAMIVFLAIIGVIGDK